MTATKSWIPRLENLYNDLRITNILLTSNKTNVVDDK